MICARQEVKIIIPNKKNAEYVKNTYPTLDHSIIEMMAKTFVYAVHLARQADALKTENASVLQCMHGLLSDKFLLNKLSNNEKTTVSAYGKEAYLNYEMMYFFIQKYIELNPKSQLAQNQTKPFDDVFIAYKNAFDFEATKKLIDKLIHYSIHGKHDYILFTALIHSQYAEKLITYELSPDSETFNSIKKKFTVHNEFWGEEGLILKPSPIAPSLNLSIPIAEVEELKSIPVASQLPSQLEPILIADDEAVLTPQNPPNQVPKPLSIDELLIPTPAKFGISLDELKSFAESLVSKQAPYKDQISPESLIKAPATKRQHRSFFYGERLQVLSSLPTPTKSPSLFFLPKPLKEAKKPLEKKPVQTPTNNTQKTLRPFIKRKEKFSPTPSPLAQSSLLSKPLTRGEKNKKLQQQGKQEEHLVNEERPGKIRKISYKCGN